MISLHDFVEIKKGLIKKMSILMKFQFKIYLIGVDSDALTALEATLLVVRSPGPARDSPLSLLVKSEDFLGQSKCTKLYEFHILQPFRSQNF